MDLPSALSPPAIKKRVAFDRLLAVGYAFIIAVLITLGFLSQRGMKKVVTATDRRAEARQAAMEIEKVISQLKDVETGQRGYLITGRDRYLAPYRSGMAELPSHLEKLLVLLRDQPEQLARFERIRELAGLKIEEMERTIALKRAGKDAEARAIILSDHGRGFMLEIRRLNAEMSAEQTKIIDHQSVEVHRINRNSRTIHLVSSLLAALIVICSFVLAERNQKRRRKVEDELERKRIHLDALVNAQFELATSGLDSEKVKSLIIDHARKLTDADGALIEAVDGDELVYQFASGNAEKFLGLRIGRDRSFSGLSIRENRLLVCDDTELDDRVDREACRKVNVRSMIVYPIVHNQDPIAVLKVYAAQPSHFDSNHANSLQLIGGILASSLGQARSFEQKKEAFIALRMTKDALERAKEEAEAATEAKSRLLANVSHEVRTPINGILGMSGMLLDGKLDDEQREYAAAIRVSGENLLAIVNDILDLSKVEAGRIELEKIDFDVESMVLDLLRTFRPMSNEKKVRIASELAPGFPTYVRGDPGRLRQVLLNLVGNALKFTPSGEVSIRAFALGTGPARHRLRFEVKDSGIGIKPDLVDEIFRPFSQGDISTTRKFGGTGLGLSICKNLVELMGGEIGVKSALGLGSTFWFTVDMDLATSEPKPEAEADAKKTPFPEGLRILVVEDNAINQKVALGQLRKLGLGGEAVGNGLEAIQAIGKLPYHLILMDCQMPEMDGYTATARIRADASLPQVPIVAMTASAIQGERDRCLKAGMDDYLTKPLKVSDLGAVLRKWLVDSCLLGVETEVFDPRVVEELRLLDVPGEPSIFGELTTLFAQGAEGKLQSLRDGMDAGDAAKVRAIAHQMKSSTGNFGALSLSKACEELELLEPWGDAEARALVERIARESGRVSDAIRKKAA